MQRTDNDMTAKVVRRQVMQSTTLNRRYVKRPVRCTDISAPVKRSQKITHFRNEMAGSDVCHSKANSDMKPATTHPMQNLANQRIKVMRSATTNNQIDSKTGLVSPKTAKQLKDEAIKKALATTLKQDEEQVKSLKDDNKLHFGFGRVLLALSCAAVAVFAIVYFVNLNMPDISLRVAAMQTGIEASYPSYIPRNYVLSDIMSEDGRITLSFKNSQTDSVITLEEEKTSWDSNALLANYVKSEYSDSYTTIREQGLTIFVDGSNATWVNGGIVYRLASLNNELTKKQIKSIATSL